MYKLWRALEVRTDLLEKRKFAAIYNIWMHQLGLYVQDWNVPLSGIQSFGRYAVCEWSFEEWPVERASFSISESKHSSIDFEIQSR